jgi:hypothetical protein
MSNFRSVRWLLPPLLAGLLLMVAAMSAPAWASGYGELLRFKGTGTNKEGHVLELQEETHAFGVDPETGSIYVGDEKEELSEEFRIQKYSATGGFEGSVILQPNEVGKKELPAGIAAVDDLEGIAVAPKEERIYALVSYERADADKVDPSVTVAGTLYAFKTKPVTNSKTGKPELVPAEGTNEEGVLASSETLGASSETVGQALLRPAGIAYDSKTKEVLILGQMEGASGMHMALDRVTNTGALGKPYVDPNAESGANSPVVSASGRVYFQNSGEIQEVSPSSESAPTNVLRFAEPEGFTEGPFKVELLTFGDETVEGGGLAIFPESETEGRLVAFAQIDEMEEDGVIGQNGEENDAALVFKYSEGAGEQVTVSESGWTGGAPGPGSEEAEGLRNRLRRRVPRGCGRPRQHGPGARPEHGGSDQVRRRRDSMPSRGAHRRGGSHARRKAGRGTEHHDQGHARGEGARCERPERDMEFRRR